MKMDLACTSKRGIAIATEMKRMPLAPVAGIAWQMQMVMGFATMKTIVWVPWTIAVSATEAT
jgi:hypothetical protein